MKQKFYLILGIIVLLIIASVVLINMAREKDKLSEQMVMLPNIEFEGTIVSFSLVGGKL